MHLYLFLYIFILLTILTTQRPENEDKLGNPDDEDTETEAKQATKSSSVSLPDESDVKPSAEVPLANPQSPYNHPSPLDNLPKLPDMFGTDLKTGTYVIAAVSAVHMFFYGCTVFMRLSYMLVTIWVLIAMFSTISVALFVALPGQPLLVMGIWIWYALIFVALMFMMMILVALVLFIRGENHRLFIVLIGMVWYALTVYFILVVNSYRMELVDQLKANETKVAFMEDVNVPSKAVSNTSFQYPNTTSRPYVRTPTKTYLTHASILTFDQE